jgi:quercetin dioxygenase-like cupin family protein
MISRRQAVAASSGLLTLAAAGLVTSGEPALAQPTQGNNDMQIRRAGSQAFGKGPAHYFTGTVRVDPVFTAVDPSRVSAGHVTFEPGARSNWHTHPLGQRLIITFGLGWVQREGGAIEEVRAGDVVWFPPGLKHWHGASPTTAMSHYSIQEAVDGRNTDWLDKVTDEQYRR